MLAIEEGAAKDRINGFNINQEGRKAILPGLAVPPRFCSAPPLRSAKGRQDISSFRQCQLDHVSAVVSTGLWSFVNMIIDDRT